MNSLPAIFWVIGAAFALLVCGICIHQSHYRSHKNVIVKPVNWAVVGMHVMTFILLALPYVMYLGGRNDMSAHARSLYEQLGWPSAIVAVVLVFTQLTLMYLQARRAMHSQIDATLREANALEDESDQ